MIEQETVFDFPCDFPVKAMGYCDVEVGSILLDIVSRYVPDVDATRMKDQVSSNGKYVSVTIHFTATSREQLDSIYRDLSDHADILLSL
jgi:putative lipoic acid-binding regulatory protein